MAGFFALRGAASLLDSVNTSAIELSIAKGASRSASTRVHRDGESLLLLSSPIVLEEREPWKAGRGSGAVDASDNAPGLWHASVEALRGPFAIVIVDPHSSTLVAARDRRGLEPMILLRRDDLLAVASDVETMLASGLVDRRVDWMALRAYLRLGYVPEPLTLVAGLSLFPAGACVVASDAGITTTALNIDQASTDPASLLREWCADSRVALLGTRGAGRGVQRVEHLLAEIGRPIELYSIDGSGNGKIPYRRVAVPRGEDAILKLLGKALNVPGQPTIAAVEAMLLTEAAAGDGQTSLLSAAGGCPGEGRASGGFSGLLEGLWARGSATPAIFTEPELPALIGKVASEVEAGERPQIVPDRHARHRATFRTEQTAARIEGLRILAPYLEADDPSLPSAVGAIETALPIAPFLEGSLRTIARELILGLGEDAILMSSAVRDLWSALRTMPRSVDPAKIWSLVALGAWSRKHRITA